MNKGAKTIPPAIPVHPAKIAANPHPIAIFTISVIFWRILST
jgi:hypothetical protein